MPDNTDALRQRIRAIMPELKIEQLEVNQEGLINEVAVVNRQYVFRFSRTQEYARILETETKILDLIRPRTRIDVPTPIQAGAGYIVYPLLVGQPLTRKIILGLDENAQNELALQLGSFLYRLHTIPVAGPGWQPPATQAPVRPQDWMQIWQDVKVRIYPLFLKFQIDWAEDLFRHVLDDPKSSAWEPVLIHGDLASYHILIDAPNPKITAVIDFGVAGIGDAASDFGCLINIYGETFVNRMRPSYPRLDEYLPRARFYAQLLELQWVLSGLKTGEAFWFTAHLGGARDVVS